MNTQRIASIFLLLTSILAVTHSSGAAEVVDRVEAIINKKAIYKSDVARFRKLVPLRMKIDPIFSNQAIAKVASPSDVEIVQFLVDEEIISQKFPVTDSDVEQEINGIQANLKIDRDSLKQAISREGFKFEEYYQLMRASLSKRTLIDREIRSKATVSEDDLKAEYNKERSGKKTFSGSFHLFLIKVTKKNYKSVALAKGEAEKAVARLKKGDSFEEVAKSISDDASASNGGDLGYLSYSDMSEVLQKEVRLLGPGKVGGITDDGNSFLVLKVADVKADVDSGFEKEKEVIRGKLLETEFQHQIKLWIERQRSLNYIKINTKKS